MAVAGMTGTLALWLQPAPIAAPAPWRTVLEQRRAQPFPRDIDGHVVATMPRRVLAGSVFAAEALLAIAPREQIVAAIALAADPRYSEAAGDVATLPLVAAEPESMLGMRPDLVVLDAFTRAEVTLALQTLGVSAVRTTEVRDFDGIADNVRRIGWAIGRDAEAENLVAAMHARLARLQAEAAAVSAWRVMNLNGALDTYGSDSLLDAAVRASGARHLPAERGVPGYQHLDVETVLSWRPDALIIGVEPGGGEAMREWLVQHPGLGLLPCVRRQRILFLPASLLASTSPAAVGIAEAIQRQLRAWGQP